MKGRFDQSLSPSIMCEPWSWRVRAAQKRSRGLERFHRFRSPTWPPSGVESRKRDPAGTFQARPERGGMVMSSFLTRSSSVRLRSFA